MGRPTGSIYGWGNNGQLRRLRYTGNNVANPPTITEASATPTSGPTALSVDFTAAANDPDGETVTYRWEFGDGTTSTEQNATHVYASSGVYTAQLSVAAGPDVVAAPPLTISVGTAPTVAITSPADGTAFTAGSSIQLSGTGDDADDGPLTGASLWWSVSFRHNEHSHPVITGTGPTITLDVPRTGHGGRARRRST